MKMTKCKDNIVNDNNEEVNNDDIIIEDTIIEDSIEQLSINKSIRQNSTFSNCDRELVYYYVTSASEGGAYWYDVEQGYRDSVHLLSSSANIKHTEFIYAGNGVSTEQEKLNQQINKLENILVDFKNKIHGDVNYLVTTTAAADPDSSDQEQSSIGRNLQNIINEMIDAGINVATADTSLIHNKHIISFFGPDAELIGTKLANDVLEDFDNNTSIKVLVLIASPGWGSLYKKSEGIKKVFPNTTVLSLTDHGNADKNKEEIIPVLGDKGSKNFDAIITVQLGNLVSTIEILEDYSDIKFYSTDHSDIVRKYLKNGKLERANGFNQFYIGYNPLPYCLPKICKYKTNNKAKIPFQTGNDNVTSSVLTSSEQPVFHVAFRLDDLERSWGGHAAMKEIIKIFNEKNIKLTIGSIAGPTDNSCSAVKEDNYAISESNSQTAQFILQYINDNISNFDIANHSTSDCRLNNNNNKYVATRLINSDEGNKKQFNNYKSSVIIPPGNLIDESELVNILNNYSKLSNYNVLSVACSKKKCYSDINNTDGYYYVENLYKNKLKIIPVNSSTVWTPLWGKLFNEKGHNEGDGYNGILNDYENYYNNNKYLLVMIHPQEFTNSNYTLNRDAINRLVKLLDALVEKNKTHNGEFVFLKDIKLRQENVQMSSQITSFDSSIINQEDKTNTYELDISNDTELLTLLNNNNLKVEILYDNNGVEQQIFYKNISNNQNNKIVITYEDKNIEVNGVKGDKQLNILTTGSTIPSNNVVKIKLFDNNNKHLRDEIIGENDDIYFLLKEFNIQHNTATSKDWTCELPKNALLELTGSEVSGTIEVYENYKLLGNLTLQNQRKMIVIKKSQPRTNKFMLKYKNNGQVPNFIIKCTETDSTDKYLQIDNTADIIPQEGTGKISLRFNKNIQYVDSVILNFIDDNNNSSKYIVEFNNNEIKDFYFPRNQLNASSKNYRVSYKLKNNSSESDYSNQTNILLNYIDNTIPITIPFINSSLGGVLANSVWTINIPEFDINDETKNLKDVDKIYYELECIGDPSIKFGNEIDARASFQINFNELYGFNPLLTTTAKLYKDLKDYYKFNCKIQYKRTNTNMPVKYSEFSNSVQLEFKPLYIQIINKPSYSNGDVDNYQVITFTSGKNLINGIEELGDGSINIENQLHLYGYYDTEDRWDDLTVSIPIIGNSMKNETKYSGKGYLYHSITNYGLNFYNYNISFLADYLYDSSSNNYTGYQIYISSEEPQNISNPTSEFRNEYLNNTAFLNSSTVEDALSILDLQPGSTVNNVNPEIPNIALPQIYIEKDCKGIEGGSAVYDECGVCDGPGINKSTIPGEICDCVGNIVDNCGVCGGSDVDKSSTTPGEVCDCNGSIVDDCGICGGDGSSCSKTNSEWEECYKCALKGDKVCNSVSEGCEKIYTKMLEQFGKCSNNNYCPLNNTIENKNAYNSTNNYCAIKNESSYGEFTNYKCKNGDAVSNQDLFKPEKWKLDCEGVNFGNKIKDNCGVCGGSGVDKSSTTPGEVCDCNGSIVDDCGICGGDSSTCGNWKNCLECAYPSSDNYNDRFNITSDKCNKCQDILKKMSNELDECGVSGYCPHDYDADKMRKCGYLERTQGLATISTGKYLCRNQKFDPEYNKNTFEVDCDDIIGGTSSQIQKNLCGECGGPTIKQNSNVQGDLCDCDGNIIDSCGVCGGDNSKCYEKSKWEECTKCITENKSSLSNECKECVNIHNFQKDQLQKCINRGEEYCPHNEKSRFKDSTASEYCSTSHTGGSGGGGGTIIHSCDVNLCPPSSDCNISNVNSFMTDCDNIFGGTERYDSAKAGEKCDCSGNKMDDCGNCGGSDFTNKDKTKGEICNCDGDRWDDCGKCGGYNECIAPPCFTALDGKDLTGGINLGSPEKEKLAESVKSFFKVNGIWTSIIQKYQENKVSFCHSNGKKYKIINESPFVASIDVVNLYLSSSPSGWIIKDKFELID